VINELYPSTSAATTFWGGIDAAETTSSAAASTWRRLRGVDDAKVPGAQLGPRLRLHGSLPELRSLGVSLSLTALYNDGSEFYRNAGADTTPTR